MKGWGGSMLLDLVLSIPLHFSSLPVLLLSGGVSIFSKAGLCSLHTSTTKGRASCRIQRLFVCFHTFETAVSTQMQFVFVVPDLTLFCQRSFTLFVHFIFTGTWGIRSFRIFCDPENGLRIDFLLHLCPTLSWTAICALIQCFFFLSFFCSLSVHRTFSYWSRTPTSAPQCSCLPYSHFSLFSLTRSLSLLLFLILLVFICFVSLLLPPSCYSTKVTLPFCRNNALKFQWLLHSISEGPFMPSKLRMVNLHYGSCLNVSLGTNS